MQLDLETPGACTVALSKADLSEIYRYVGFQVPDGATRLDVTVDYDRSGGAAVDVGVFDPTAGPFPTRTGFRGWSGSARDAFTIARDAATPGYVAGEIPPGRWQIILGLYMIPDDGVEVSLTVRASGDDRPAYRPPLPARPVRSRAGWYRGDLHAHTFHSDARGSPEDLHRAVKAKGLDFLAITDHNTTTAWDYFAAAGSPDLLFIPGVEITTYRGHANVFGLSQWVDFRLREPGDVARLVSEVRRQGALISVNHDKPPHDWRHELPDMDCMEVWQRHWWTANDVALARYDARLRTGRRITLIGASDYHTPAEPRDDDPFGLGTATTVLWLAELSQEAVIAGLRRGLGYVTESPDGPHLDLTVDDTAMGGTCRTAGTVRASVHTTGALGDRLLLVGPKGPVADRMIETDRIDLDVQDAEGFLRAEIIADASLPRLRATYEARFGSPSRRRTGAAPDLRRALSNPVYIER